MDLARTAGSSRAGRPGLLSVYALGGHLADQDRSQGWLLLPARPSRCAELDGKLRGFGLGRQDRSQMMLQVAAGTARNAGKLSGQVRLTVDPANPAQRLYFRLGYQQLAESEATSGPGEDRLLLEKALT